MNSSTPGQINPAGDSDCFRLDVTASGTLTIYTTGTTNTYGYLLDGSGHILASDEDSGESLNFLISHNVSAGTYYVRVRHFSEMGTGAYTLVSEFEPEVEKIRKQFGLKLIYHPDCDFDEDDFLASPIFQDPLAVSYETHTTEDNGDVQGISTVWDDHYIKLKIDISINRKKEQILSEIEEFIESSRIEAGILEPGEKEPDRRPLRMNKATFQTATMAWDLHRQGKTDTEIIKALWPKDYAERVGDDIYDQEKKYIQLLDQYEREGDPDPQARAWREAYGVGKSGLGGLHVRVEDKVRRMKKLLEEFGPIKV